MYIYILYIYSTDIYIYISVEELRIHVCTWNEHNVHAALGPELSRGLGRWYRQHIQIYRQKANYRKYILCGQSSQTPKFLLLKNVP